MYLPPLLYVVCLLFIIVCSCLFVLVFLLGRVILFAFWGVFVILWRIFWGYVLHILCLHCKRNVNKNEFFKNILHTNLHIYCNGNKKIFMCFLAFFVYFCTVQNALNTVQNLGF